jgi:integrase
MPRKKPPPEPDPPRRRPPGAGSVVVRGNGRIGVYLPKDLDPKRRPIYGPGPRQRFASAEQATAWLDAEITRRRNPTVRSATLSEPLGAYLARWLDLYGPSMAERTRAGRVHALRRFQSIAHVALDDLTPDIVQGALVALQAATWRRCKRVDGKVVPFGPARPYTPSTIRLARSVLHLVLGTLVPHILPYNPVARTKLPKDQPIPQPVWDAAQSDRFLSVVEDRRPDLLPAFLLLLQRGLRRGEVLSLRWADLDARRKLAQVDETAGLRSGETGGTKGRRTRDIPLSDAYVDLLLAHRKAQDPPSQWMFPGRSPDKPLSLGQFNAVTRQLVQAAGLPRITPKDMRATAATILLDENVALARVSRLLGHSTVAVTARFYDRVMEQRRDRTERLAGELDAAFKRASDASKVSIEVSDESATR